MVKNNLRKLSHDIYEITIDDNRKVRLAVVKGKLYVCFIDVCRLIGYKTVYRMVAEDTEFFKLDIETPWRTGNRAGKKTLKYIDIDNAAKFVRDRII